MAFLGRLNQCPPVNKNITIYNITCNDKFQHKVIDLHTDVKIS